MKNYYPISHSPTVHLAARRYKMKNKERILKLVNRIDHLEKKVVELVDINDKLKWDFQQVCKFVNDKNEVQNEN